MTSSQSKGVEEKDTKEVFAKYKEHFLKENGGWKFTQAVGWLRLYILGTEVRGETWLVDAKRISPNMKSRKFIYYGEAFELEFMFEEVTSTDIYDQVLIEIEQLSKVKPYERRYLDLETFRNIGGFIDWRQLIGLDN